MANFVTLKSGAQVPDDHPLYLAERGAQQNANAAPNAATPAAPTAQPATSSNGRELAGADWATKGAGGADWVKTPDGQGWVPPSHPMANNAPASTPTPTAGAPAANSYNTPTTTPAGNSQQTIAQAVPNAVVDRLTQPTNLREVMATPEFTNIRDSYAATQERARRNAIDNDAERLAAQGLGSSGRMDTVRRMESERAARDTSSFEGQLALQELGARRNEVAQALQVGASMLSQDQQMALQRELAALDAQLKRESLAQTGALGESDIALRRQLGMGNLNLGAMGLALQNRQFGQRLGFDIGSREADLNMAALRAALGI